MDKERRTTYNPFVDGQIPKSDTIEMIQCRVCGIYFPKRWFMNANSDLCNDCLKKDFDNNRKKYILYNREKS